MRDFENRMTRRLAVTFAVAFCIAGVAGARAHAQEGQFVLIDATFTASAVNTKSSEYGVAPLPGAPENWRAPIDYSAGSIHVRVEVLEKPSAAKTLCNVCFFANDTLTCMPYPPPYTMPGIYESEPKISTFWQHDVYPWTTNVERVNVVVKDENGRFVQGNSNFFPTKLHVTVTVIPPGGKYVAPDGPVLMDDGVDAGVSFPKAPGPANGATVAATPSTSAVVAGAPALRGSGVAGAAGAGSASAGALGARGDAVSLVPLAGTHSDIRDYIDPGSSCAVLHLRPKARYGVAVIVALSLCYVARISRRKRHLLRDVRRRGLRTRLRMRLRTRRRR